MRRKGKSAPYREVWWEWKLVGKGVTCCGCGCGCGDSEWITEAICRWKQSNMGLIGTRVRST